MHSPIQMTASSAASNASNMSMNDPHTTTPRVSLELCGFDADSDTLLLAAHAADSMCAASADVVGIKRSRPKSYMRREFVDLQHWDRQLSRTHKQQHVQQHEVHSPHDRASSPAHSWQRLPTRRVRKLMGHCWLKHDAACGWRIELQKNVAAVDAWLNAAFRLLPRDEQHAFLDNEVYQRRKRERAVANADVQHARDLQQYFTSQPLVDLALARVAAVLRTTATARACTNTSADTRSDDALEPLRNNQLVWFEPSCGDGRFVSALLAAGAHRVVGVEIDSALCTAARAATSAYRSERVEIVESDFLATQRSASALMSSATQQPHVCVIGNPPFGDRTELALSTDLIQRFVAHAAREWRAELVAFIVPERCARTAYVTQTLETLACASAQSSCCSVGRWTWRLALSESLEGYSFEFGRTKRVKQPSVLLVYTYEQGPPTQSKLVDVGSDTGVGLQ